MGELTFCIPILWGLAEESVFTIPCKELFTDCTLGDVSLLLLCLLALFLLLAPHPGCRNDKVTIPEVLLNPLSNGYELSPVKIVLCEPDEACESWPNGKKEACDWDSWEDRDS